MSDFKVTIPRENYSLLEFNHEGLPGIAVVNTSLKKFKSKEIFPWHLSLTIDLKDLIENGMPSKKEVAIIDSYGDFLDEKIKGKIEKPNALFMARVTWNKTRELVWRVYDAKTVDDFLKNIVSENTAPREFEYSIQPDENWDLTEWYIKNS